MKRNPGVWRPGIRTAPRFPKQAVQAAQEVETAAQRPIRAREQSATRARPSCPPRSPWSRNQAGPGQHRAATERGSAGAAPRCLTPPAESPGSPCGAHRRAAARAIAAYLEGVRTRVPLALPGSAGRSAAPRSRSRRAERSAAHRRDQRRRDPPATPRPAPPSRQLCGAWGPGRGRGSRREARGTRRAGPPRTRCGRAQGLERAQPGRGAKGAGAERGFCFLFSLWFPARRRKTFIPGQFRFLVGVAPGRRRILLSSAPIVCPVSFLVPHKPQFARGQDRRTDLEDPKVPLRFNVLEF